MGRIARRRRKTHPHPSLMRFFKWSSRSPRRSPQPAIASAKAGGEVGSERSDACRAVALAKAGGTSPSPQGTPGSTPFSKGLCSASLQAGISSFSLRSEAGTCPDRGAIPPSCFYAKNPGGPKAFATKPCPPAFPGNANRPIRVLES
jgi:hypothetical protein